MTIEHKHELEIELMGPPDFSIEHAASSNRPDESGALFLNPSSTKAGHTAESRNNDLSAIDSSSRLESTFVSRPLWWLYCIHGGFTPALPSTALMFLINTHIRIPLNLLPTYGAIAFLPYSLKPLYAYFSSHRRDAQLSLFLACDALLWVATSQVPENGVGIFIVLSFVRGITSAWPEFLLGLSLVDEACHHEPSYEQAAAKMQAQAATARNVGSLAAYGVGLLLLGLASWRKRGQETSPLDSETAFWLLIATSSSSVASACTAYFHQVGRQRDYLTIAEREEEVASSTSLESSASDRRSDSLSIGSYQSSENLSVASGSIQELDENTRSGVFYGKEVVLVVLLQVAVILLALKHPITQYLDVKNKDGTFGYVLGYFVLFILLGSCCFTNTFMLGNHYQLWTPANRVGLFLILRNLVPTAGFLLLSFRFEKFAETPILLQLLSLLEATATTGASWTFGCWVSGFCAKRPKLVLATTTALAAVVSLSHLWFVQVAQTVGGSLWPKVAVAAVTSALTTWTGEWSFLPDVILATMVLKQEQATAVSEATQPAAALDHQEDRESNEQQRQRRGIQYGSLITCIDFGDQLGALLTGALVSCLGVTRENDWGHLENFICLCSLMTLVSISFLILVR